MTPPPCRDGAPMAERTLKRRDAVAVLCLAALILVLPGCGSGSGGAVASTTSTSGKSTASADARGEQLNPRARKRLLVKTIAKLDRRNQACEILSDRFLKDSYGAPGELGRQRCQAALEERPPRELRSYRIVQFKPRRAEVFAVDSSGSKAVMTFVFARGQWLLDDARSPGAADY